MKKMICLLVVFMLLFPTGISADSTDSVAILINGQAVTFTGDSGYPYVDENSRTMVPLRVTMETAGFAVGYDPATETAIVITEHRRIEVPIGTNILYVNNTLVENDTVAVVKNGRTYLPIRAVLEAAGFTVEWEGQTSSVNAYSFDYNANDFVPYSTSSLETLVENALKGNIVYVNGQWYATPDYVKLLNNVKVHYSGSDLNTAIYPQESRYDAADVTEGDYTWIGGAAESLPNDYVNKEEIDYDTSKLTPSGIPGYYVLYYLKKTDADFMEDDRYFLYDMTTEFLNSENAEGTFSGIRMKKEDGMLWIWHQDLRANNLEW